MSDTQPGQPISAILVSFMAMPANAQVELIDGEIPTWRGAPSGPLSLLMHAIDRYMGYFFDHFPAKGSQQLLDELAEAKERLAQSQADSLNDFIAGEEWEALRSVARKMLRLANFLPCAIPQPLPLREWADHFAW